MVLMLTTSYLYYFYRCYRRYSGIIGAPIFYLKRVWTRRKIHSWMSWISSIITVKNITTMGCVNQQKSHRGPPWGALLPWLRRLHRIEEIRSKQRDGQSSSEVRSQGEGCHIESWTDLADQTLCQSPWAQKLVRLNPWKLWFNVI